MRQHRVGDRVSIRPDGKRGHGLGDVIAVGPVNVRVQPCGGQLWLDEHGQTAGTDVQTGLML